MIKAGVMGWPVSHSLSPRLHSYWLHKYKIEGSYQAMAIEPQNLQQALRQLSEHGYSGVNLTIPHKEKALALVDTLDSIARRIGAVNTVVVTNGTLEGGNTDAFGFAQNLLSAGVDIKGKAVTVLGAGGGARAVIVALQDLQASEIRMCNRTRTRAEELKRIFGGAMTVFDWENHGEAMQDSALLVNTTSLGMQTQPALEISLDNLPTSAAVNDLVYAPLMTGLLQAAQKRGNKTIDGLGMLLHQARPAFEAFFGQDPEVTGDLRRYMLNSSPP